MTVRDEQSGEVLFSGFSEKGSLHILNKLPNQDAIDFLKINDCFFMAVSDGLGSCKNSQTGAQAAMLVCRRILLLLANGELDFNAEAIIDKIRFLWKSYIDDKELKDYSCTLKTLFFKSDRAIVISVGDGMGLISVDGRLIKINSRQFDFVNETVCIGGERIEAVCESFEVINECFVVFSTDGVSGGLYEGGEENFINELMASASAGNLSKDVIELFSELNKYNSDDKTMGILSYAKRDKKLNG